MEQAFGRGQGEPVVRPLVARSRAVLLHCVVDRDLAHRRFVRRHADDPGRLSYPDAEVVEQMDAGTYGWDVYEQLVDIEVPHLVVDTTDGYAPDLDAIEAFIWRAVHVA